MSNDQIIEKSVEDAKQFIQTMDEKRNKWASRKFWISIAAFLGSIGTAITGLTLQNEKITTIGVIATILSQAIYAAAEAYVDANK